MRALVIIGLILVVLGVASLFVPIPRKEKHGFDAGGVSLGIETTRRDIVHPAVSAILIGGGIALTITGSRKKR
jgi:hypothetical protein